MLKEDNKERNNKGEGKEDQSHEEENLLVDLLNMLKHGFPRKAYLTYLLRESAT